MTRRWLLVWTAWALLSVWGAPGLAGQEGAWQPWHLSDEPVWSVHGADALGEDLVDWVSGATRLSDGTVVVANTPSSLLRYFDSDGTLLRTVGGQGDGSGRMRGIVQVVPTGGDTVMVLSVRPGLTWFGPDGEVARSTGTDLRSVGKAACRLGENNWQALADGSIVAVLEDNFKPSHCPDPPSDLYRESGLIGRGEIGAGRFDTLAIMPATERNRQNFRVYGKALVLGLGEDRIYAGDTGAEAILALGFEGDTLASIPTPFVATPVPDAARSSMVRRFTRPNGRTYSGSRYRYPEAYPRFGRLLVARTGELWVMAYPESEDPTVGSSRLFRTYHFFVDEGGALWRVTSPSGEPFAELRTPPRFYPLEVGTDYVLGVSRDDRGVETVEQYALIR